MVKNRDFQWSPRCGWMWLVGLSQMLPSTKSFSITFLRALWWWQWHHVFVHMDCGLRPTVYAYESFIIFSYQLSTSTFYEYEAAGLATDSCTQMISPNATMSFFPQYQRDRREEEADKVYSSYKISKFESGKVRYMKTVFRHGRFFIWTKSGFKLGEIIFKERELKGLKSA